MFVLTLPAKKYFFLRVCWGEESIHTLKITCEMFFCVMFVNHPTIVAFHENSFCKYLKLLAHILLIKLCLQCITGTVRLAPVRSKSSWLCQFPVYQHAIYTFERSLSPQIFCKKSSSTNFLRKINQVFQWNRPRGLRKSRDSNSPVMQKDLFRNSNWKKFV